MNGSTISYVHEQYRYTRMFLDLYIFVITANVNTNFRCNTRYVDKYDQSFYPFTNVYLSLLGYKYERASVLDGNVIGD